MAIIADNRIVQLTAADLWAYLKNPARTMAAWRQGASPHDLFPPSPAEDFFTQRGKTFESAILTKHEWVPSEMTIEQAFRKKIPAVFMKPWLEHEKACVAGVHLVGEPDIVRLVKKRNTIEPEVIDIKSHKTVQYPDQIQVALYCFALARMLGLRHLPAGYVRLRSEREQIERPDDLLSHLEPVAVDSFYDELCQCIEDILTEFQCPERTGVLVVHGIGLKAQKILAREGVTNLEELAEIDEKALLAKLKHKYPLPSQGRGLAGAFASLYQFQGRDEMLLRWKYRARAILEGKPLVFNPQPVPSAPVEIYFDLEYDDGLGEREEGRVWLASLLVLRGGRGKLRQFFAATPREEKVLLQHVLSFLTAPDALIVTYAGTMADLPRLKDALKRHGYDSYLVREIKNSRHLDLFPFLQTSVALPLREESFAAKSGYGFKEVETIFGIPRQVAMDGFEALIMYHEFLKMKSSNKKRAIKKKLLEYAAEDVQNLRVLKSRLSELMRTGS